MSHLPPSLAPICIYSYIEYFYEFIDRRVLAEMNAT
jgi:hypothetical protein